MITLYKENRLHPIIKPNLSKKNFRQWKKKKNKFLFSKKNKTLQFLGVGFLYILKSPVSFF